MYIINTTPTVKYEYILFIFYILLKFWMIRIHLVSVIIQIWFCTRSLIFRLMAGSTGSMSGIALISAIGLLLRIHLEHKHNFTIK